MTAEKKTETEAPAPEQAAVYVVQRLEAVEVVVGRETKAGADLQSQVAAGPKLITAQHLYWVDIATVPLPPKSMRRSAIRKALADAGIKAEPGMDSLRVRVLDAESARVHEVPVVVAEPTFGI